MSGTITKRIKRAPNTKNRGLSRSLLVFLPIFTMTALSLGLQQGAAAAEIAVSGGNAQALIQAIKDANANPGADVITLGAGVYTLTKVESELFDQVSVIDPDGTVRKLPDEYIYGPNGLPLITSDITIKAAGSGDVVIKREGPRGKESSPSESNRFRFFHVRPGASLRLEGITLQNGYSRYGFEHGKRGGAIFNEGKTFIHNGVFIENSAGDEGGAIVNRPNAVLEVRNSTFERNTLLKEDVKGGTLGGAIINIQGRLTVDGSTFNGNATCFLPDCITEDGDGGAIENIAGDATITNSTFFENKSVSGGAIENNRGKLTIVNSTFYKNVATRWAGAIGSYGDNSPDRYPGEDRGKTVWGEGIIIIINSTIVGNHAGDDGVGREGFSTFGGGGILVQKGAIVLKNTILADNTAPAGMPQNCTGYPYFHKNPVYIISAGNNIIGDTDGCLTVPTEMPYLTDIRYAHEEGGKPLFFTLDTGTSTSTDLKAGTLNAADLGLAAYNPGSAGATGAGHLALNFDSRAINKGDNILTVELNHASVGGTVCAAPGSADINTDQIGNSIHLEVRDIGAIEYVGAITAAPASLDLLGLPLFVNGAIECAAEARFVADGAAAVGSSSGAGGTGGNDTSGNTTAETNTNSGGVNTPVPAAQTAGNASASTGGGSLGPWALMIMMGVTAFARRRRQVR